MSLYFNAFILVIVREHPSCTASTDWSDLQLQAGDVCPSVSIPYLGSEGSSKFLNTRMKTIYHAASSYLSFLVLSQIVSRAIKQESKKTKTHDAENTNNLLLEHGVRAISCLWPFLKNRHEKPGTILIYVGCCPVSLEVNCVTYFFKLFCLISLLRADLINY